MRVTAMPEGLLPVLIVIAFIIVYAAAKIVANIRKSREQWEQVDKSKLREWEDDED